MATPLFFLHCHVMSCNIIIYPVMPCQPMLCPSYAMPYHAMQCYYLHCTALPCHIMPCHYFLCTAMSCHAMPLSILSCSTMTCPKSCHAYHAMQCYHLPCLPCPWLAPPRPAPPSPGDMTCDMTWYGRAMPWHDIVFPALPCHAMTVCAAVPCNVMQWYCLPCPAMSCNAMPLSMWSCRAIVCTALPCHTCTTMSYHAMSLFSLHCHVMSCNTIIHPVMLSHDLPKVMPCISCHAVLLYALPCPALPCEDNYKSVKIIHLRSVTRETTRTIAAMYWGSILTSFCAKRFDVNFFDRSRTEYFLLENVVILV